MGGPWKLPRSTCGPFGVLEQPASTRASTTAPDPATRLTIPVGLIMGVLYHTVMHAPRRQDGQTFTSRVATFGCVGVIALLLTGCLTPRRAEPRAPATVDMREPEIRVRLARLEPGESLSIGSAGRLTLRDLDGSGLREIPGPVTIAMDGGFAQTTDAEGLIERWPRGMVIAAPGRDLLIDGRLHPGWIEARPTRDNALEVIAELGIENYLPGVLEAELPSHWLPATFKAQAVAARGYALDQRTRARRTGRAWDVTNTTSHQVYVGRSTNITAIQAVAATRGQVLTHGGVPMPAYYSAVCGGRNASPIETWGQAGSTAYAPGGPLDATRRPHHCQHAPRYAWSVARSTGDTARRLAAWGRASEHPIAGLNGLVAIEAERINAAGRPVMFRVIGSGDLSVTLRGEQLRIALNHTTDDLPLAADARVHSSDLAVGIAGDRLTIEGRGFGHGVGMCQWGAQAMAEGGADLREILARYYPGADLSAMYR